MSELNHAQREALLASANKHEEAAKEINAAIDRLKAAGYTIYADELREVVIGMIHHVDHARDLARKP
jgi:L-rhamnose mutarotase